MRAIVHDAVSSQFEAALAMLENAIHACPEPVWTASGRHPPFWYLAFHTLFFADYYLAPSPDGFAPPPPFSSSELDPDGAMPERAYSKAELLDYLAQVRVRLRAAMTALSDANAGDQLQYGSIAGSRLELLLYNLRHVQHHAAQLNLLLRQAGADVPRWVASGSRWR
jgi:hypothetical protein